MGPAKLPKPILTKIHGDVAAYVKSAEFAKIAEANGSEPVTNSPEVFRQFMLDDMKKWGCRQAQRRQVLIAAAAGKKRGG